MVLERMAREDPMEEVPQAWDRAEKDQPWRGPERANSGRTRGAT